ncbi:hypothetical protein [Acinetobacter sp. c3-l95]|uniref:hypothetical protein n=1 Tax=Acinetobacter sp. c3-l95 TaxID=3342804 RepID=UPI0035BA25A7
MISALEFKKTKYELFSKYKKPTSDQVAFMQLYEKEERTKEEEKLLQALTKKFKAYDDFLAQKKEVDAITQAEQKRQKEQERKARNHKLIVLGSALLNKSETDNETKQLIKSLINDKFINEKDANLFVDDIVLIRQSLIHELPR